MSDVLKILAVRYKRDLRTAVDTMFRVASEKGWSWEELAQNAGLRYNTVWRLGKYHTQLPRYQTVWKIAQALGLQMIFIDAATSQRVSLEDLRTRERRRRARPA